MKKRIFWLSAPLSLAFLSFIILGLVLWLSSPETCLACTEQVSPSPCGVNLSTTTVRQGDNREAWWDFMAPHEDQTLHVYLGLNNNQGSGSPNYSYQITYEGEWNPDIAGVVTPTMGSGQLGPAGSNKANETIEITIPYSNTQSGDLVVTAIVKSQDGTCIFPEVVTSTVRLNQSGPTVWPVTPRTCPKAGEVRQLTFGIRNPTEETQIYNVVARAYNPRGGSASDQFNLNGQGPEATLPSVEVKAGKSEQVEIDCETFGYCVTGGENRVEVKVFPTTASEKDFEAMAWSNITIRDPESVCPEVEDWWFLIPPLLLLGMIGVPSALVGLSGATAWWWVRRSSGSSPVGPPPTRRGGPSRPGVRKPGTKGSDISHGRR